MIHTRTWTASRSLETLFRLGNLGNLDDGQLLEWFRTCSDARGTEAFRVLVERYGAIVMGVCRSVLGDVNEADDAFQATFLILVRRAGSIRDGQLIGPWLHGVALRVARRARARANRRYRFETPLDRATCAALATGKDEPDERIEVVHEEIARLPEQLRRPLILCCLDELTYVQAARQLGVSEPTLRGRLHRGRQRLEARLRARGLSVGAILPLDAPANRLLAPVSHALVEATVQLASKWITVGALVIGAGSSSVHVLAQGVIQTMIWNSVKLAAIPALIAASVLGTAVLAQQGRDTGQVQGGSGAPAAAPKGSSDASPPVQKQYGEPKTKTEDEDRWKKMSEERLRRDRVLLNEQKIQKKTAHIRELLAGKSDIAFPDGVSLEQFLKTVKSTTTSGDYGGIPIYVNPQGLQDVEKTLESRGVVRGGPTLADVLEQSLREHKLGYVVEDGFLRIDSRLAIVESRLSRVEEKLDRIEKALEKIGSRP